VNRASFGPWLLRRLALALLVVLGAATVAFAAMQLLPGDPVRAILGVTTTDPQLVETARHELGFDQPLLLRYLTFLGHLITGDLGRSYQLQEPVAEIVGRQVWPTLQLALTAYVLALVAAVVMALLTAGRRRALRSVSTTVELIAVSSPSFWLGALLLAAFSFRWHLLPASGDTGLSGLILPSVTLAAGLFGVFTQVLRQGLERALEEPFVLTSRTRGTGEGAVRLRHALRHAIVPLVSLSAWVVGALLTGAVVVETMFSRPGLGRTLASAVTTRDFPVVTTVVVLIAAFFTLVNIGVDVLYRIVDPRVREVAK
jgi:peptide/nickel transport system permease protein